MVNNKKFLLIPFLLFYILLFNITTYANEDIFCCNTEPEIINELHNSLIDKKISELNSNYNPWSNEISLFSQFIGTKKYGLMPSTGRVKALVVNLDFPDIPMSEEKLEEEKSQLNKLNSNANPAYFFANEDGRSVTEIFKAHSNGKLNFTADVMPVYTASENKIYYQDNNADCYLVTEALEYYDENGYIQDYSDYDSDNDGIIDCLIVVSAYDPNVTQYSGEGRNAWMECVTGGSLINIKNDKLEIKRYIKLLFNVNDKKPSYNTFSAGVIHECGHLMGLDDNYEPYDSMTYCTLFGTNEVMADGHGHFNAYYRYLLDWIEPKILLYEDSVEEIDLRNYGATNIDASYDSIIWIPDKSFLPFTEFYMIEYRNPLIPRAATLQNGIIIWHVNTNVNSIGDYVNKLNYIKPVYKSNDETKFKNEDLYRVDNDIGDEWSSETTPSSNFYDDVYTGAYMKVIKMDDEKATIQAGFKNPDLGPAPGISISPPSKKAVKSGEKQVEFTVTYENADKIGDLNNDSTHGDFYSISDYVQFNTTGTVTARRSGRILFDGEKETPIYLKDISGEGTISVTIKERSAWSTGSLGGRKYAPAVTSEVIYVDNTPPEITLNGNGEITLDYGEEYEELGAKVTDNLDPDIENKLKISGTVDTNKAGAYTVTYDATDHAENKAAQVVRTVTVLAPPPSPTPTVKPTASPSPTPTAKPTAKPTASPNPTPTAKPTASPSPTPTAKPTASPSPTPTAKPTASPNPTPTAKPTASPSPTPTAKPTATPSPTPTVKPTATPSPTPTPTATQSPSSTVEPTTIPTTTPEPSDRVEFENGENGMVFAKLVFEKTTPPKQEDILLYIAYYRDNRLIKLEIPTITEMTAMFKIDEALQDCEIKAYVWDKEMKPLMEVQKIDL